MIYLPITLEIDEPEQIDAPLAMQSALTDEIPRSSKKVKSVDIILDDAPKDGKALGIFN